MAKKTGKRMTEEQKQKRKQQRNTERAYKRQRERIEKTITVETNMGGIVPPNILPPIPKKITEASVRRLKRITNISIISKTYYTVNRDYGEVVKGIKGRSEILKPQIKKPDIYEYHPHIRTTKELMDEYIKESNKRLDYLFRKGEPDWEALDRRLEEQERKEKIMKKYGWDEETYEREKRLAEIEEEAKERQRQIDEYEKRMKEKGIEPYKEEELFGEEQDDYYEREFAEDDDREFQGRTREQIDEEYERQRAEKEQEEYDRRVKEADAIFEDSDWDWQKEESDDERIRRRFEESLRKQDAEAEKEKIKEQQEEEYIEKLKRLHDEEMKRRREEAEKYSDEPVDETEEVLEHIEDMIRKWEPEEGWSKDLTRTKEAQMESLREILEDAIKRKGRDEVAKNLQEHASTVMDIADDIAFGYSKTRIGYYDALNKSYGNLTTFFNIVNDELSYDEREALSEGMEEDETEDNDDGDWFVVQL